MLAAAVDGLTDLSRPLTNTVRTPIAKAIWGIYIYMYQKYINYTCFYRKYSPAAGRELQTNHTPLLSQHRQNPIAKAIWGII